MRRTSRLVAAAALAVAALTPTLPMTSADAGLPLVKANVSDHLAEQLTTLAFAEQTTVMVHGTDLAAANRAVTAAGMTKTMSFDKIGVVVARATAAQIAIARVQPGVTYVEGNQSIEFTQYTSNTATAAPRPSRP